MSACDVIRTLIAEKEFRQDFSINPNAALDGRGLGLEAAEFRQFENAFCARPKLVRSDLEARDVLKCSVGY